jgi:spermidine synthase
MKTSTPSLRLVACLLFVSGACALVYQVAWFRELRLIFGASTAASAAVLAVFMGGLGFGGMVLGRRADASPNPLGMYAKLEGLVAVTAALTPLLVQLADRVYVVVGGTSTLGTLGATVMRLMLTVIVLGPPAVLMGGTLPAAARAIGRASDLGRQRIATLYGVNTLGAVTGTVAANFVLLEVFGTRTTLWIACLMNLLLAVIARSLSRTMAEAEKANVPAHRERAADAPPAREEEPASEELAWFPPTAAAVAGFAFMLMELVWYRMLAPLLGGSSYTFGLILALALVGIGIGGLLYSRTRRPATIRAFAVTCALEALALAIPFALGDRLALFALLLRPLAKASFGLAVLSWTVVASIVVLPAAIVSGYQFPLVIGLYGRGASRVGRHVGSAYLANTLGSIVGSLAGGFGILPLLTATRTWELVTLLLVATAVLAAVVDLRRRGPSTAGVASAVAAAPAALFLLAPGPTAAWRHSGIGAGRADLKDVTKDRLERFLADASYEIAWEAEGLESSVAVGYGDGLTFIVNGKSDGSILGDSGTQVMSGMLAALLHGHVKNALVIGLGTGSTAGWLGLVPDIERVDVIELEPAILRVARDCAVANGAVLDNPKVKITIGDAREVLRTTHQRYDVVFSEPSNPYRAGISSLYTLEFYQAAAGRLNPDGLFVQWIQAYEVDALAVTTAAVTLRQVFPSVSVWQTMHGDLLLIASRATAPIDVERLRAMLRTEPYHSAARVTWKTTTAEGILARFVARPRFVNLLADSRLGLVNTDDQNFLEFAFARNVGIHRSVSDELRSLAERLDVDEPEVTGSFDRALFLEEQLHASMLEKLPVALPPDAPPDVRAYAHALERIQGDDSHGFMAAWTALGREPRTYYERVLVASAAARVGHERGEEWIAKLPSDADRDLLRAIWLMQRGRRDEVVDVLERGLVAARKDPWVFKSNRLSALSLARHLGHANPAVARRLAVTLREPFAVQASRTSRLQAALDLARASGDARLCIDIVDAIGTLPMTTAFHEARVDCYERANDPRLPAARAALARLQAYTLPFGADLPDAPRAKRPMLTAGSLVVDGGSTLRRDEAETPIAAPDANAEGGSPRTKTESP